MSPAPADDHHGGRVFGQAGVDRGWSQGHDLIVPRTLRRANGNAPPALQADCAACHVRAGMDRGPLAMAVTRKMDSSANYPIAANDLDPRDHRRDTDGEQPGQPDPPATRRHAWHIVSRYESSGHSLI
jgi:hypothetical protein